MSDFLEIFGDATYLFSTYVCPIHFVLSTYGLYIHTSAAPYPVRPARPWPYLDFEKEKAAAAAAARRHYRGLTWLGRARRAGGAPELVMNGQLVS